MLNEINQEIIDSKEKKTKKRKAKNNEKGSQKVKRQNNKEKDQPDITIDLC